MKKTLQQLRAEAYAAFRAHEVDMKSDPKYAAYVERQMLKSLCPMCSCIVASVGLCKTCRTTTK